MGRNGKGRRDGEKLVQERARKEKETRAAKAEEEVAEEKATRPEKQEKSKAGPQEIKCEFISVFCDEIFNKN